MRTRLFAGMIPKSGSQFSERSSSNNKLERDGGSKESHPALQNNRARESYSLIVRITEVVGRVLTVGSLISLATISSYCGRLLSVSLAFICTTL